MILIFGAILMDISVTLGKAEEGKNALPASSYNIGIGGHGALHAIAAAKAEARTALVGQVGDDHYGKNINLRMRQTGVITSGIGRSDKIPTGTIINIGRKKPQVIVALGANTLAKPSQAPSEIIKDNTIVMLQDELSPEQNMPVIETAKSQGATIIITCTSQQGIKQYSSHKPDYLITQNEDMRSFKINEETIETPALKGLDWVDNACTLDAFAGTFAAGLYKKESEQLSKTKAAIAAFLCASKTGGYRTLPYPDAIKDTMELLDT